MNTIIFLNLIVAASAGTNVLPPLFHPKDHAGDQSRIIGGSIVNSASTYPHQASLFFNNTFTCGGAIVSDRWIVTAGREINDMTIRVGAISQTGGTVIEPWSLVVHENYGNFMNDIGLVQTRFEISFNTNTQPIRLATELPAAGATHTVTGWGHTAVGGPTAFILKQLNTDLQKSSVCCSRTGICHEGTVCFYNDVGQGTCNGDSGSPCIYEKTLVALVNFGVGGCASGYPDGMASIPHYRASIQDKINSLS